MEVMSSLDSAFLRMESAGTSLGIASVAIFEGPPPSYDEIRDLLAAKISHLPRYRQRVREVPLWLGRPVWVEDPRFDVRAHLRRTALPAPGGSAELGALMGRVMSQQLDRSKPLWEEWLVEGLGGGRWALLNKVHHCMVDGIAGTDLLTALLDKSRNPDDDGQTCPPAPPGQAEPGAVRLLGSALTSMPHHPADAIRAAAGLLSHPRNSLASGALLARGALAWTRLAVPAGPSSLSGPLGRARSWDLTRTTFDDIHAVRAAHGGTFNDVVIAAMTRGFRDLLISRGERPADHAVRTLIPVSVRKPGGAGRTDNEVSAMIIDLPVHETDAIARLAAVRQELDRVKNSGEVQVAELMSEAGGWTSPLLLAIGLTGAFRLPHRHLVTVATNVPGPRTALYACGRRMQELYAYVPIADRVRIGVAMTSYDRVLTFGITADTASTPDYAVLTAGICAGMRELVDSAGPLATQR